MECFNCGTTYDKDLMTTYDEKPCCVFCVDNADMPDEAPEDLFDTDSPDDDYLNIIKILGGTTRAVCKQY